MACKLGIFAGPKTELEPQLDQVDNMPGSWGGGGGCHGHDGVDDAQGGGLFPLDWGIFDPVSFEFLGKARVQSNVRLGFGGFLGWIGHPGGGLLQSPPMSEKPIVYQFFPLDAWSNGCDGPVSHRLGRVRCEGRMDLLEQYLPTGWNINQSTAGTSFAVSYPE